jgi:hypothetical protein
MGNHTNQAGPLQRARRLPPALNDPDFCEVAPGLWSGSLMPEEVLDWLQKPAGKIYRSLKRTELYKIPR